MRERGEGELEAQWLTFDKQCMHVSVCACTCAYTYFFVCPGKYLRYLLSCNDKYRIVSVERRQQMSERERDNTISEGTKSCNGERSTAMAVLDISPSTLLEVQRTALGECVQRTRSQPYFLLLTYLLGLRRHRGH